MPSKKVVIQLHTVAEQQRMDGPRQQIGGLSAFLTSSTNSMILGANESSARSVRDMSLRVRLKHVFVVGQVYDGVRGSSR